ncbi:MAG: GC-type dockerin domain-anchored protein [Phycisphaerales bacterium]
MAPGVQVGEAQFPGSVRAALWRGTAASFVDFNPSGQFSMFLATTGRVHVGLLTQSNLGRAAINFGAPTAWLGLHQFLPAEYGSFSSANAVYQDGDRIYVGGWAESSQTSYHNAILWIGTDPCYPNCDGSTAEPSLNVVDFICFLNLFSRGDGYANCDRSTMTPVLNVGDFVCFLNRFAAGCS